MKPLRGTLPPPFDTLHLDRDSGRPLHRQIEAFIRGALESGALDPGDRLPPEVQLSAALGVSRHTVRHALGALVSDAVLHRRRGSGTRIAPAGGARPIERTLGQFYAFAWETRDRGLQHRSRVLSRRTLRATAAIAERLGISLGTEVERIERLRLAGGEPLVLETAYLPGDLSAALNERALEEEAVYDVFERIHGIRISGAREILRPSLLDRRAASLLEVRAGAPAFLIERSTHAGNRTVEWQESLVRGDRFLYAVDLPRREPPEP